MTAIVSISSLNPLKLLSNQIHIWPQLSRVVNSSTPTLGIINLKKNKDKFNCFLEIRLEMAAKISIFTLNTLKFFLKPNSYLISIFRRGPVNPSTTFSNYIQTLICNFILLIWVTNIFLSEVLYRRDPVNPSTLTYGTINLTETMTNLIVAWQFNLKWLQKCSMYKFHHGRK